MHKIQKHDLLGKLCQFVCMQMNEVYVLWSVHVKMAAEVNKMIMKVEYECVHVCNSYR